jgi:hypothetical protein
VERRTAESTEALRALHDAEWFTTNRNGCKCPDARNLRGGATRGAGINRRSTQISADLFHRRGAEAPAAHLVPELLPSVVASLFSIECTAGREGSIPAAPPRLGGETKSAEIGVNLRLIRFNSAGPYKKHEAHEVARDATAWALSCLGPILSTTCSLAWARLDPISTGAAFRRDARTDG